MIRVVIADDQGAVLPEPEIVLNVNPDMEVVDTVSDGGCSGGKRGQIPPPTWC